MMARVVALGPKCLLVALTLVGCQWRGTPSAAGVATQADTVRSFATGAGVEPSPDRGHASSTSTAPSKPSIWLDTSAIASLSPGQYLSILTDDFQGTPWGGLPDPASRFAFVSDRDLSTTWIGTTNTWVLFSQDASLVAFPPETDSILQHGLGIMDVREGSVRFVPRRPPYTGIRQFSWDPSGREIAMDDAHDIWLLDVESFSVRRVTNCGNSALDMACYQPVWAPSQDSLAYRLSIAQSGAVDLREGIYVLRITCDESADTCGTPLGPFPESAQVALSPDGTRIALYDDEKIVAYSCQDSSKLWSLPVPEEPAGIAWSPSGNEIAIGVEDAFWLIDAGSGDVRATADMGVVPMVLSWVVIH
jgi:hypothetical protein